MAHAPYRSVHIDTLAPGKLPQFEGARREWVGAMRAADASDGRGLFILVDDNRFFTLRPFDAFASFDTRGAVIEASLARVPKEAAERYDRLSDTALVFPHTSEIWRLDDEMGYRPAQGAVTEATAAVGTLILDDVRPDPASEERWSGATREINAALAEARYPLTRLVFDTVYGAGHVQTLVLAPSKEVLDAAPTVEAAVASVRGAARAAELTAAAAGSIDKHEAHGVVLRHDLTWP